MEISELRIDDAVQVKGHEFYYPVIIDKSRMIDILTGKAPEYLPIPIILSQMERLGFHYSNRQYTMPNHFLKNDSKYRFVLTIADEIELWQGLHIISPISDKKFKYIHEIQNVWFELTGEELTFKID